jgi:hypothetical protein
LTTGYRKNNHYQADQHFARGAQVVAGWINADANGQPALTATGHPNHQMLGPINRRKWHHQWKDLNIQRFGQDIAVKFHTRMARQAAEYANFPTTSPVRF